MAGIFWRNEQFKQNHTHMPTTLQWIIMRVSENNTPRRENPCRRQRARAVTFSSHADLEALLEPAVLALVAVVLIDDAVLVAAASVLEVSADRALEETFAALARILPVMSSTNKVL